MTTPNAELAYKVLDYIDAHPEQHDQSTWLRKGECGTVGCFAGNAVILAGLTVTFREPNEYDPQPSYDDVVMPDGRRLTVREAACEVLGLRYLDDDEDELFDGYNLRADLGRHVKQIFGPRPGGEGGSR